MAHPPRRHVLLSLLLVASLGLGGCLTLSPTVGVDTDNSTVFEDASTTEPWVSGRVKTSITLASNATTTQDVNKLAVISESGDDFDTVTLDTGQTTATVYVPANQNATIVAIDTVNGTTIDTRTIRTDGNKLF
ncbi:MAG TPA: hypothetical protein VFJ06_04640 [Halococcus sp.]|nr:hypothetical protein [Halococcus sp.]